MCYSWNIHSENISWQNVLKKPIMLHIRRALCAFSDGLCICRVLTLVSTNNPTTASTTTSSALFKAANTHYTQLQLTDTCHENNTAKESYRNTNHNNGCWCHTVDTRSEFSQNVYFICHFICLPRPPPLSTADSQSTRYWLRERSVIKERESMCHYTEERQKREEKRQHNGHINTH